MTVWWGPCVLLLLLPRHSAAGGAGGDAYDEVLTLRPLPDARTVATFQFAVGATVAQEEEEEEEEEGGGGGGAGAFSAFSASAAHHFDVFPKALGQVVLKSGVRTFNLAITKGTWDYDAYGALVPDHAGPPGAELRADFGRRSGGGGGGAGRLSSRWTRLKAALGGIFCASLSTIDETTTLYRTHPPAPTMFSGETVGFLWREMLCTENLVPVIKLLPCRDHAGLSAYLRPLITAEADFMSLAVRVRRSDKGATTRLHMDITVVLVLPSSSDVDHIANARFDISRDLLGGALSAALPRACPTATSSKLRISRPAWGELSSSSASASSSVSDNAVYVSRPPDRVLSSKDRVGSSNLNHNNHNDSSSITWEYDMAAQGHAPLSLQYSPSTQRAKLLWQNSMSSSTDAEGLNIQRSLTGTGRYLGGLKTRINVLASVEGILQLSYLDVVPWYLRAYAHSVKVVLDGETIVHGAWRSEATAARRALQDFTFVPSRARSAPGTMSATLTLKPGQVVVFTMQFELAFLQFEEFPPDANRGFDVPGAIVQVERGRDDGGQVASTRIYTETLMIEMPYPDFSMPYNVITLTSTLLAFIAGTMLNLLGRKKALLENKSEDDKEVEEKKSDPKETKSTETATSPTANGEEDGTQNTAAAEDGETTIPPSTKKKSVSRRQERTLMPPTKLTVTESLGFEVSVHSLPRIVLSEVEQVLPSVPGKIIAVLTAQKSKYGLVEWGDDVAKEKDELLERFAAWCKVVIKALEANGHWADYIDPCSGLPANSDGNKIYGEVDGFQALLGYRTQNANCCKILLHPVWGAAVYPATLFTNAPAEAVIKIVSQQTKTA
jgi:phosphatidylinositol glycan class T